MLPPWHGEAGTGLRRILRGRGRARPALTGRRECTTGEPTDHAGKYSIGPDARKEQSAATGGRGGLAAERGQMAVAGQTLVEWSGGAT